VTALTPTEALRAAAIHLDNRVHPNDVDITLARLLREVAECVDDEGGTVQDSTTECAVEVAHALLAKAPW
jgi:hypothetical protein